MPAYFGYRTLEYRYYTRGPKRRKFHRTKSGAYKHWELERCLNDEACPLDDPTKQNLRFLIGLRHEIEHHESAGVDEAFTGRYIACVLNYEREVTRLFGDPYSVAANMLYALQLRDLTSPTSNGGDTQPLPSNVARYIAQFDSELPSEDYQHPHFSYRLLFVRKLTTKHSQADRAIEFIGADTDLAKEIDKQYWVQKEVERPKTLPDQIVDLMRREGYSKFNMHHHTLLWKEKDAKNPGKGYGVMVANTWYWYEWWVGVVRDHCSANSGLYTCEPDEEPT